MHLLSLYLALFGTGWVMALVVKENKGTCWIMRSGYAAVIDGSTRQSKISRSGVLLYIRSRLVTVFVATYDGTFQSLIYAEWLLRTKGKLAI